MSTPTKPLSPPAPPMGGKPDHPRPASHPRRPGNGDGSLGGADGRKLIVGRDITVSGEIGNCDVLLVEGTVEARLHEGRLLEISETGSFKGTAETVEAEISGRFEGELIVHGRLKVRAGGRIQGVIRYAELEVEAGGQLQGDVQLAPAGPHPTAGRPAAEPSRLAGFPQLPPASVTVRTDGANGSDRPPPGR